MTEENNQKPAIKIRSGPVSCAVWENQIVKDGKTITLRNITFQRSYRDPETGQWHNSDSFTPQSLGNLLIAIFKAAMELCRVNEDSQEDEEQVPI